MAFWSPVSCLVTFGTMGITCWAVCSASWVLSGAVGTVLGGCRWCVTTAVVAGVGHLLLVLVDSIHWFGAVGYLFPGMLDGKVVHSNVSQLIGGCLEWLCHKFPKELSLMVVCTDDMAMQFVLTMLIIDHLAAVNQCLDACDKILGSSPSLAKISSSSPRHTQVLMSCVIPCWVWSRKTEAFALVHFLFLFAASRHPLCMHLQGFGSQGCKDISEVVLTVQQDVVEEEQVLQGTPEYGEGVIGILGVPVIDGQADGCHPSCQHTSNGIGSCLGKVGNQLLWSQFGGHVSGGGWSDNGQIRKTGRYKNAYISGTVSPIYFKLRQGIGEGVPYHKVAFFVPMILWGAHGCMKCNSDVFLT